MSAAMLAILRLVDGRLVVGDVEGAAALLRGAMAMTADAEPTIAPELRAVRKKKLAQLLDCTTRHVEHLERRGLIGPSCVLGAKGSKRYLVGAVFAALGKKQPASGEVDTFADEVRADVRRKARMRISAPPAEDSLDRFLAGKPRE